MNWVDLLIVILIFLFAMDSFGKPFILEALDLMSFVLAFILSLDFYNLVGKFLEAEFSLPHSLSNVLGFIAVWYLVDTVFYLFGRSLFSKRALIQNHLSETPLSLIPGALKGLIFVAIILIVLATVPIQPQIKSAITASKIGSAILGQSYRLEAPLRSVFGGLGNDTLTFLTVEPKTNESVNLGFQTTNFTFDPQKEMAMIDLVNSERMSRGIKVLTYNSALRDLARGHSADMFRRGYFSHYSPEGKTVADRANEMGVNYQVIGENLAYAPSLALAHQGLMNSPSHRANILSPDFNKVGIGIANGYDYGLMITQVFTN